MAKTPWTPWHEVVRLRNDLKSGDLPLHMFAADLYDVLMQSGRRAVYENPEEFFALTFPTHNLRNLVRDVMLRVAGKNDKAVRQLELTYGGGKTHTLITLLHLVRDPDNLPDLPAVREFEQAIGEKPTAARVAGLCFDKLDVEKGMEVRGPAGETRELKMPWSVLAYQLAGDEGLKLLHADDKAEERETAPAENLLIELLEMPQRDGLSTLILMDEVLMYAREKVAQDHNFRDRLVNFFQYLTQAATKVDRCCMVASLLATDPKKSDKLGRELLNEFYDIFRRQKEEGVEPVVKEDVAEVLRRRFFKPESIRDKDAFRPHVIAALKGISVVDEQTVKNESSAEERFCRSFPFHPDLTEVLYEKWTQLSGFQKTRGLLRTLALALREAAAWDKSPLVGPNVFLAAPDTEGLSEAMRELVTVADTEEHEGRHQAWTSILDGELERAAQVQEESVGLHYREIEQAVVATFLHSQPVGHSCKTRELMLLLGATRPDKIELEKGVARWAQVSHWLDDRNLPDREGELPSTWRLGNRPNLNQMQSVALKNISPEVAMARLLDEIPRVKSLTEGARGAGVQVHMLPTRPRDVEDDGTFHYAVLGANAASESGKPSAEAKRFLEEHTGPDKPRVYRNAILLLTPSKDGIELAVARVREYLAWEQVRTDLKEQEGEGHVDVARMQTLTMNIDKAKKRIPDAVRQAYCIVVTISDKDEPQAFKIMVGDESHFTTIKNDDRSRMQDTAITAETLLPDGPYDLWREGETARRVKDLSGAFAQLPHLPKMLRSQAILETLADGCEQGAFVLRLTRPDHSFRTWWRSRPDEVALNDPALELVLPEAAELADIEASLLAPQALPALWNGEEITVQNVIDYFDGTKSIEVDRGSYKESVRIPKASREVVEQAVSTAVEEAEVWLLSGPASIFGEEIPAGVLTADAKLHEPPPVFTAAELLPQNLPDAWKDEKATALAISTALSQKAGKTLPWKTIRDVITGAINARFIALADSAATWPCEFSSAGAVEFEVYSGGARPGGGSGPAPSPNVLVAVADLEPSEIQDLADAIPQLLDIKAQSNLPLRFNVHVHVGDGSAVPPQERVTEINSVLETIRDGWKLG